MRQRASAAGRSGVRHCRVPQCGGVAGRGAKAALLPSLPLQAELGTARPSAIGAASRGPRRPGVAVGPHPPSLPRQAAKRSRRGSARATAGQGRAGRGTAAGRSAGARSRLWRRARLQYVALRRDERTGHRGLHSRRRDAGSRGRVGRAGP